jgi:hypothetical protein
LQALLGVADDIYRLEFCLLSGLLKMSNEPSMLCREKI